MLRRLLDPARKVDYAVAFAIGAVPIACALLVGAADSFETTTDTGTVVYRGYLASPSWWSLALLIPAALFVLRWAMGKIAPVARSWSEAGEPPVIRLVRDDDAKPAVYARLRSVMLDRRNVLIAFSVALLITAFDMRSVIGTCVTDTCEWTSMVFVDGGAASETRPTIGRMENGILVAVAYFAQLVITFIGLITIALLLRHNLFFIGNIYQRRRADGRDNAELFHVDVRDVNRCFGFRAANEAFNTQVICLTAAGMATLASRYSYSSGAQGVSEAAFTWPPVLPALSFPAVGQWAMALAWLAALVVVALPGTVKLLPRLPSRKFEKINSSVGHYLREFFSERDWPKGEDGSPEPVPLVAARFAENSFWPTGDNRAGVLFFFSYWVFLVLLLPPPIGDLTAFSFSMLVYAVVAYGITRATFLALKLAVRFVDEMLTDIEPIESRSRERLASNYYREERRDLGIFISYRRKDAVEYARSIHKALLQHFEERRLFRDITDIEPGEDFIDAIHGSLSKVDVVIVMIGTDWLSASDDQGRLRLHKPDDVVRLEVQTALQSGKRVIPVLVEGAAMPGKSELPEPLKPLSSLNALEISNLRWDYDVGRLIDTLKRTRASTEGAGRGAEESA